MVWKWDSKGVFIVASLYSFLIHPGEIERMGIWEAKIPEWVIFFFGLMAQNRLLTQENLMKR
jgi:hypothetical protein